tara:strand:+ start:265 stop:525 length:261 start_codon:yes stop_codon:yes gene_type:complete
MEIKAYTKVGCKFCGNLIELFERAGVEYTTIVVGEKANQCPTEIFQKEYPEIHAFPFVVIDGKKIGGLVETAALFLHKKLVTVKKK